MPPAQPVELAALVAYQDGAVVSRTLVKKSGGTVTVFAFDVGQALSEHTAPFDAIVQILDGDVDITVGGNKIRRTPDRQCFCPPGSPTP